ncbi:MAG: hypothetical protein ACRD9R_20375 [Pyrinomonadaceae bacterium]
MTIEEHNKALGISHLVYGGLNFLLVLGVMAFFLFALLVNEGASLSQPAVVLALGIAFVVLNLFLTIPHLLAGYAILKRKSWARVIGIVSAVLAAINIPHGTALCVYTMWFFFGEGGRRYQSDWEPEFRYSLKDAPPPPVYADWFLNRDKASRREHEFAPPPQPPDWRG